MGAILDFIHAARSADRPETGPAEVVLFPTVVSRSRWLRREGLRVAASVNGASILNVRRVLKLERERAGVSGPAVDADVADALAFVEAVAAAADQLGRFPSHSHRDGGAA